MQLETKVLQIGKAKDSRSAFDCYHDAIWSIADAVEAKTILEVGGGRFPTLKREDVEARGVYYTSNDISSRELERAPEWVGKACFDVQTPDRSTVEKFSGQFDLVFSRMVMEHVASYERAYQNIYTVLRPGGVSIAFHPVLYAFPFVINKLMPERASQKLLRAFFANRNDDELPKFPAVYSGCRIAPSVQNTLREIGFQKVWQLPFYGHGYYKKIPVLRDVHKRFVSYVQHRDITGIATYAYTIVQK